MQKCINYILMQVNLYIIDNNKYILYIYFFYNLDLFKNKY